VSGTRIADPRTGIPFGPGTIEFLLRVRELDIGAPAAPREGTLGALIASSPEFTELAPRTRADYERVLGWIVDSPLAELVLEELNAPRTVKLRDKAFRAHGRRFANYVLQLVSRLCNWGKPRGWITVNPVYDGDGIEKIRRPHGMPRANRKWRDHEFEAVFSAAPISIQLALAHGRFGGMREADAIALPWSAYDGATIIWHQQKTGAEVFVPVIGRYKRVVDAAAKAKKSPIMVTGARGNPFQGTDGFRSVLFKLIKNLEAANKVAPGLTFHGLRHIRTTEPADAGGDRRGIAAALGHETEAMSAHYTAGADKRQAARATVLKLERGRRRKLGRKKG